MNEELLAAHDRAKLERHGKNYAMSSLVEFSVQFIRPVGASIAECRAYVWDAVCSWAGSYNPEDDPMFHLARETVTVHTIEPPRDRQLELQRAVSDAVTSARTYWFLYSMLALLGTAAAAFAAGAYFASNLYG